MNADAPVCPSRPPSPPAPRDLPSRSSIEELLRDPATILARIDGGGELAPLARAALLTVLAGTAALGAAIGAHRGGVQILYAALKLPMTVLVTAALAGPALTALNAALDRPGSPRRDLALVLVALARGSLVLAALAPAILLAEMVGVAYHRLILVTVACCALGGAVGLSLLVRGLERREARLARAVAAAAVAVVVLVGAQAAWTFRPYLVRPQTPGVPFLRAIDGSLVESVARSFDSARGVYRSDEATGAAPGEAAAGGEGSP